MDVRPTHSMAECIALLHQFFVSDRELKALMEELVPPAPCDRDRRRAMVERLASSLWAVFSHHRAVIDGEGVCYDLGPWRSAAELISDLANRAYPDLNLPIRYMDCYVGVLSGEQRGEPTRRLHRWIFEVLQDEGCDWLYSRTAVPEARRARARMREMAAVLDSSDRAGTAESFIPVPAMIAAYQDVYHRLPDGWPHA
jgi:hypothetical protein